MAGVTGTNVLEGGTTAPAPLPPAPEEALRLVVEGTSGVTGREFFRHLVRSLSAALGYRYAMLGELAGGEPPRVRSLAFWAGDDFAGPVDYALLGTPCADVAGGGVCHYARDVSRLFPGDTALAELGAESYLGVPLLGSAGVPLGVLVLMHDRPTEDADYARSILRVSATRAAAELERQRHEEALRESERRFHSLAEASPAGMFRSDLAGRCTYVNTRCCQITGVARDESRDLGWTRALHPDDHDRVMAARAEARAAETIFQAEYRFVHADGRVVWVLGQTLPERDASGRVTAYVGTLTDLTERKRIEAELRQSEHRYQALAETSAVGIWQVTPTGETLYINPAMRAALELEPGDDLRGRSYHGFFTPESLEVARREHAKRPLGVSSSYEVTLVGDRGGRVDVVISGAPVIGTDGRLQSLIGTFTDITARKRAEEALRDSEARLRLVVGQMPAVLWTTDRDLRFTSCEGAGLAQLGASPGAGVGKTLFELFGRTDRDFPAAAAHLGALRGQSSAYELEWEGRTFQSHVEPLCGAGGGVTGVIGLSLDVTERKGAERALRQAHDDLELRVRARTAELSEVNAALRREVEERRAAEGRLRESERDLRDSGERLRQSEQRYASILNTQQTLVSRSDPEGRITYVNAAHARAFGSKVGDSVMARIHPDDLGATRRAMEELQRPPHTCTLEQRVEVGGEWRRFLWQGGVIRDASGRVVEFQAVGFDMTDRRRAEEALRESERRARESERLARDAAERERLAAGRERLAAERERQAAGRERQAGDRAREAAEFNRRLVLEVDHRVRNNLAGLLSLVSAMREKAAGVAGFADAIEGRLLAMAHVHQLLADAGWRAVDLGALVSSLLAAVDRLGCFPIATRIDGPALAVSPRQALPLSMILLEWFTNSCKYGAFGAPSGRVDVTWEALPAAPATAAGGGQPAAGPVPAAGGAGRRVRLRWRESGGPPVRRPVAPSLGTELVRGFASLELRGTCELCYPDAGADHVLEFPVE